MCIRDRLDEEHQGGRLPGEEMRISIARRRGGGEAWTNYRRARRMVKLHEKRATLIANQISAAQTEAKIGDTGS